MTKTIKYKRLSKAQLDWLQTHPKWAALSRRKLYFTLDYLPNLESVILSIWKEEPSLQEKPMSFPEWRWRNFFEEYLVLVEDCPRPEKDPAARMLFKPWIIYTWEPRA